MRVSLWLGLVLFVVLPVASAEEPEPAPAPAPVPVEWLWLHYLAGDNDLESPCLDDMEEIRGATASADVRILVLVDRHVAGEPEGQYVNGPVGQIPDFDDTRVFELREGKLELVAEWGEANMGDPDVLQRFVSEALAAVSAKRVALVLSDHGSGWPGICADESADGDDLTLPEIARALKAALPAGRRIDLLSMDACVMAMLEVAHTLAPFARVLVASEELEPGTGYDYQRVFGRLAAKPAVDALDLGRSLIEDFRDSYEKSTDESMRDGAKGITMSAVDLDKVGALAEAAQALGALLGASVEKGGRKAWIPIAHARARAEQYGLQGALGEGEMGLRDLDHFAEEVARALPGTPAAQAAQRVRAAVTAAVLRAHRGHTRPRAAGLAVFLPPDRAAYESEEGAARYGDLPFATGGWTRMLEALLAQEEQDAEAAIPTPPEASVHALEGEATLTLTSNLTSDDVEEALLYVGREQEGRLTIVGTEPADVGEDGAMSTTWDGGWFAVAEGEEGFVTPVQAYEEIEDAPDSYAVEARVGWQRPGRAAEVVHLFFEIKLEDEDASGTLLYAFRDTRFGARQLDLAAGDVLRPLHLVRAADGTWSEVVSPADDEALTLKDPDALGIDYVRLPAGTWQVGYLARDLAGNLAAEGTSVELK